MKETLTQFAQQVGITIDIFEQIDSTNNRAAEDRYNAGDVVLAERQEAGRGQRGNTWNSAPGENLTFSVVLCPDFLTAERQFRISKVVALAVADTIAETGAHPTIKWPNDIYIGDRKATGILIENDLIGSHLCRSVIGVGLNVNQTHFDPSLPNPTSLAIEMGHSFDRAKVFINFYHHLSERYRTLTEEESVKTPSELDSDYLRLLYRFGEEHLYADLRTGRQFLGTITNVLVGGELEIRHSADGQTKEYLFKQVEYVIGALKP